MGTKARIATICQAKNYFQTLHDNRSYVMGLLDMALQQRPDLVCLPEAFSSVCVPSQSIGDVAESLPGPTTDAVSERARQSQCYVICPVVTRRDGAFWNSAVVIDRQGHIIGVYDKLHPVTSSSDYTVFENGTSPGGAGQVFDLDFGRIGIQICFDIHFPESWLDLAEKGARVVFWPSAYNGGFPLQMYASRHHFFVVSSVQTEKSRIIDPCGTIRSETDYQVNLIWQDINLDFAVCHYDFNYSIPDRILTEYPGQVSIRPDWDSGRFLIEPNSETLTIQALREKLGFITVDEYAQLHRNAFQQIHVGSQPTAQIADHGDRPMYRKERIS